MLLVRTQAGNCDPFDVLRSSQQFAYGDLLWRGDSNLVSRAERCGTESGWLSGASSLTADVSDAASSQANVVLWLRPDRSPPVTGAAAFPLPAVRG